MNIQGLPTQSTTASVHKFGDRGYDNERNGNNELSNFARLIVLFGQLKTSFPAQYIVTPKAPELKRRGSD